MALADIASEIYADLESPATPDATAIATWLQAHVGDLNTALGLTLTIVVGELSSALSEAEKSVFKLIYMVYYCGVQIRRNLGAGAYDWSEITEGDSSIRRVSKNEIAKTFQVLKRDTEAELLRAVNQYRFDKSLPTSLRAISDLIKFVRTDP